MNRGPLALSYMYYNFNRGFLPNHLFHLLALHDKNKRKIIAFSLNDIYGHLQAQKLLPQLGLRSHEIYNFGRSFLAHHYYKLCLIYARRFFLKKSCIFHYMIKLASIRTHTYSYSEIYSEFKLCKQYSFLHGWFCSFPVLNPHPNLFMTR